MRPAGLWALDLATLHRRKPDVSGEPKAYKGGKDRSYWIRLRRMLDMFFRYLFDEWPLLIFCSLKGPLQHFNIALRSELVMEI